MVTHESYPAHSFIDCIDAYVEPEGEWAACPRCNLTPLVWEFDNGRHTACGCWKNQWNHWTISAEPIGSVIRRTGGTLEYDPDGLRKNWNHYCKTGEILFAP